MNPGSILSRILKGAGDDVAGKIGKQYSAANLSQLAASSADDIARTQGNMLATHQLTSSKLGQAADLGGFVQPSMAVVDPSKATNFLPGGDFGEIVMVANRNAIDPARKASKSILGDRDIYSPRFPDTTHEINMPAMDDLARRAGTSKQSAMVNMDVDSTDPQYMGFLQDMYRKENPAAASIHNFDLREMPEFKQYANDALNTVRGEKVLTYRTPSGARKNIPYNADNANKLMSKASTIGGESWHESPHAKLYHQNTTKLKSLDDIYKNKYRFIDNQTGDATKDAMGDYIAGTAEKINKMNLPELQTDNQYEQYDRVLNYVADAASGRKDLYPALDTMPQDVLDEIAQIGTAYKDVPVSYFEAKPRRVVGGNEFHGAYIPDDSSPEVMKQLERLGVKNIKKYLDKGDLDLQLAGLAKEGKRGIDPYVLSMAGALPTAGILSGLLGGGQSNEQQMM